MSLQGKRIVVTRAAHQAGDLADLLRTRGAEPLLYPCIASAPPEDANLLDAALRAAAQGDYDLIALTSANTVEALRQRCELLGLSLRGIKAAAVGPATADAARTVLGLDVQIVPEDYIAESLAESLNIAQGTRIFLPQADIARRTLADLLVQSGAVVTAIPAYRTVRGQGGVDLPALLNDGLVDAITFTSSSTVENCIARVGGEGGDLTKLRTVCAACIGPKTADSAAGNHFAVILVPQVYTLPAMVESLTRHFSESSA